MNVEYNQRQLSYILIYWKTNCLELHYLGCHICPFCVIFSNELSFTFGTHPNTPLFLNHGRRQCLSIMGKLAKAVHLLHFIVIALRCIKIYCEISMIHHQKEMRLAARFVNRAMLFYQKLFVNSINLPCLWYQAMSFRLFSVFIQVRFFIFRIFRIHL